MPRAGRGCACGARVCPYVVAGRLIRCLLQRGTDHQRDERVPASTRRWALTHGSSVPEHRHPIADREHLVETMRDEHRRHPVVADDDGRKRRGARPHRPSANSSARRGSACARSSTAHARSRPSAPDPAGASGRAARRRGRDRASPSVSPARASRCAPVDETRSPGMRRPRRMFSAIDKSGASVVSWLTVATRFAGHRVPL